MFVEYMIQDTVVSRDCSQILLHTDQITRPLTLKTILGELMSKSESRFITNL